MGDKMSHFMFGDFFSENFGNKCAEIIKKEYIDSGLIIYFNQELQFYNEIDNMLAEHMSDNNIKFCITSEFQKYNSEDVLFPFGKYDQSELFPNGDDRSRYNELCNINLKVAKNAIEKMMKVFKLNRLRIFITSSGYDDNFRRIQCDVDEMFSDILAQVQYGFDLISTIYDIKLAQTSNN